MTISSSLNAGVSGLSANATRLSAISDNIANASTSGYKRVEADFAALASPSSGGKYAAGGVRASTTRMIDQKASFLTTENPTDLAVRGRGFIPVTDRAALGGGSGEATMMLATTGSFRTDEEGYLVTSAGRVLMGWPANPDGTIGAFSRDSSGGLEPIRVNMSQFSADPTTEINLSVNLPSTDTLPGAPGDPRSLSVEYYGNLGQSESLAVTYTPTGTLNEWTMTVSDSASATNPVGTYTLAFNDDRTSGGTLASVTGGTYDATTGSVIVNVGPNADPIEITIGKLNDPAGMSQLGDKFAPVVINKDGSPIGNMISLEVDANGFVRALFDTGISRTIYQVPLVDLPNPNGMVSLDAQTYMPSYESGPYFLWDAGDGPTGEVVSYAREESATDVAGELTAMIQTQRAYSTNAKVIQTVDEMLQETTNIKR